MYETTLILGIISIIMIVIIDKTIQSKLSHKQFNEKELELLYQNNDSIILKNSSSKETIAHTRIMLKNSKEDLKMISGTLSHNVFNDAEIKELMEKKARKNKIEIITSKDYNKSKRVSTFLKGLKEKHPRNVKIEISDKYPKRHMMVSKPFFRIEEKHEISATDFKAIVGKDKEVADKMNLIFDDIRKELKEHTLLTKLSAISVT